jgi:hypothetical protein
MSMHWPQKWKVSSSALLSERTSLLRRRAVRLGAAPKTENGWAIAGRFPGGRPLRRLRETVWMSATNGCEGPCCNPPPGSRSDVLSLALREAA